MKMSGVVFAVVMSLSALAVADGVRSRRVRKVDKLAIIPSSALSVVSDAMARLGERARAASPLELRKKSARKPDYVETETFQVERLSPSQVETVIRAHLPDLAACSERYSGHAVGSVTIALTVEPSGVVSAAAIDGLDSGAAKLGTCMSRAARTWSFPVADGETEVRYPLQFSE